MTRATPEDLPALAALYDQAAVWLQARGIMQWQVGEHCVERLAQTEAFVAQMDGEVLGGFTFAAPDSALWPDAAHTPACYLSGLVLARSYAGLGLALLAEAERLATAPRLRFDCWDGNDVLKAFYTRAGFRDCGAVPEQNWVVRRFEKGLAPC